MNATHSSDLGLRRTSSGWNGAGADRIFHLATKSAAWFVLVLLIAVAVSMAWGGRLAFSTFGFGFITASDWDAVGGHFGALVPIYGTLVTSAIALLIAVPVSIGIGLFLTEIAPRWTRGPIGVAIELLAAIPSIIYGMWGLFIFAPFMAGHVEPWLWAKQVMSLDGTASVRFSGTAQVLPPARRSLPVSTTGSAARSAGTV